MAKDEVVHDPSLRDPKTIGHVFTEETKGKLRVGSEDFLLPEEERMIRGMLERHGKAFAFSPQEIGCANPKMIEPMVIFTVATCTLEPQANTGSKISHSEVNSASKGKGKDGNS